MEKNVIKRINIDLNDLRSCENYFAKMSKEGLHLVRIIADNVEFARGERKIIRYCIIPVDTDRLWPDPEMIEHYKQTGWDSVCPFGSLYHVFSTEDPGAADLHTDPQAEKMAYEKVIKRQKNVVIAFAVVDILCAGIIAAAWLLNSRPTVFLVKHSALIILMAFFLLPLPFEIYSEWKKIRILQKKAESGEITENDGKIHTLPKENTKMKRILSGLMSLLIFCSVRWGDIFSRMYTIEEYDGHLPFVSVYELADEDKFVIPPSDNESGYNINSRVRISSVPFGKIYGFYQLGYDDEVYAGPGSDIYVIYSTESFETVFPSMAGKIVRETAEQYPHWNYEKIDDERFDELYICYRGESGQHVAASKGNTAIIMEFNVYKGDPFKEYPIIDNLSLIYAALDYEREE